MTKPKPAYRSTKEEQEAAREKAAAKFLRLKNQRVQKANAWYRECLNRDQSR